MVSPPFVSRISRSALPVAVRMRDPAWADKPGWRGRPAPITARPFAAAFPVLTGRHTGPVIMARPRLTVCLLAFAAWLAAAPAFAQFGSIFRDEPPRPPADVPSQPPSNFPNQRPGNFPSRNELRPPA